MKKLSFLFISLIIFLIILGIPSMAFAQNQTSDSKNILNNIHKYDKELKYEKIKELKENKKVDNIKNYKLKKDTKKKDNELNKKSEEISKIVLIRLLDNQIKWFNNTKERVQKMPNISNELKSQLTSDIDSIIKLLNDEKNKIQNLSNQEEIKSDLKEIKDFLKFKNEIVKKIIEAILSSRNNNSTTSS